MSIHVHKHAHTHTAHRLIRRPSTSGVLSLLAPKTLRATPPLPPSWSVSPSKPRSPVSTRADARSFHVTVFQMGGEIDKQYENSKVFYGEPAALRIFQNLPFVGLTYDVVRSFCFFFNFILFVLDITNITFHTAYGMS